ncbi:MAG: hypothetical protein GC192_07885 [Bacteroidetes bacterium]|nr:hypothetical protein [Bacteroidota bacterium]
MNSSSTSSSNDFQQLQVLHGAMMMGAVLIAVFLGFMMTSDGAVADFAGLMKGFLLIAMVLMAAEISASNLIWRSRQAKIPATNDPAVKWMHYRTSCIIRWALLEGGVLISVVLTFLEQNLAGFCIAAVGLVFLLMAKPSRDYVADQYRISV